MGLDIRLPMGLFFTSIGALLALFGALADQEIYRRSLDVNVNLVWGLVMMLFGIACLALSRRRTAAMHPGEESPEGRAIEAREHRTGLERD